MRYTTPYRLLAFMAIAACSGCRSDTAPIPASNDEALSYPQITLSQRSLQGALGFQKPVVTQTGDNLMQVTVPVRARSNQELHVEYKVVWLDASGRPVPPDLSWRPLRLEPRQPHNIIVNATSPKATDYNMQFRWSRP